MGARDVERLLRDPGIVRHRGKIEAAHRQRARGRGRSRDEFGSLAAYVWRFEPRGGGAPAARDARRPRDG